MSGHKHTDFAGVILAAGRGTRMMPFSERYPKPLLPVLNTPMLHHQIEYLRSIGIRRVFVVIGHLGHEIALDLRRGEALGVEVEYVEQQDSLGIAHALMQLEPRVNQPFVLLLGDVYFEVDRTVNPIVWMLEQQAAGFLAVKREPDSAAIQRNFAVHLADDHVVHRVVEKPRFPRSQWKGCGIYVFDVSFFDSVRRTPRTAGRNEYEVTDAIQTFIDDGAKVVAKPLVTCDFNLTFPRDLLIANLHALRKQGQENVIAPDAQVHPDAKLSECVIGARSRIDAPISLRRTLILPDTVVTTVESCDRVIITPDMVIDCKYWIEDGS